MVDKTIPEEFGNGRIYLGWVTRIEKKKSTFKITVNRQVSVGCGLKTGEEIFGYYTSLNGRPVAIYYLDGKDRNNEK